MKRFLIFSAKNGIFLGRLGPLAIFSKTDTTGIQKAYTFDSIETANKFVEHFPGGIIYKIREIEVKQGEYASYIDLIKAGYADYIENMGFYAESPSKQFH